MTQKTKTFFYPTFYKVILTISLYILLYILLIDACFPYYPHGLQIPSLYDLGLPPPPELIYPCGFFSHIIEWIGLPFVYTGIFFLYLLTCYFENALRIGNLKKAAKVSIKVFIILFWIIVYGYGIYLDTTTVMRDLFYSYILASNFVIVIILNIFLGLFLLRFLHVKKYVKVVITIVLVFVSYFAALYEIGLILKVAEEIFLYL